ncbi:MAG: Gfo/Idh/MocA family oxidoreductase [Planctomycetota bacterium]|jgi:predicted dehydrogenase|nr:Gfo/Idh/MocA family oxidoreductase [Planctomycetota bacterium]
MVKVAILGAGAISGIHIAAYKQIDNCEIVAVADVDGEKAAARVKEFGLSCRVHASIGKLAADPGVEMVSVCLPPLLHAPAAVELAAAGKHVLVEKPMAMSLREIDEMNAAADAAGILLGVISQNRYKTDIQRLKGVLDSGLLGRVLSVRVDSLWWRGACYYDLKWRGRWESEGGGPTLNHAIHQVDGLVYLMGRLPARVVSVMANLAHANSEIEDISHSILTYEDNAVGLLSCSVVHHGENKLYEFQCEKGAISLPFRIDASLSLPNGFPKDNAELVEKATAVYDGLPALPEEGHVVQLRNMVDAVEKGEPLLLNGKAARQPVELVTALYKSAFSGSAVDLPISVDDAEYGLAGRVARARKYHEKTLDIDSFPPAPITL